MFFRHEPCPKRRGGSMVAMCGSLLSRSVSHVPTCLVSHSLDRCFDAYDVEWIFKTLSARARASNGRARSQKYCLDCLFSPEPRPLRLYVKLYGTYTEPIHNPIRNLYGTYTEPIRNLYIILYVGYTRLYVRLYVRSCEHDPSTYRGKLLRNIRLYVAIRSYTFAYTYFDHHLYGRLYAGYTLGIQCLYVLRLPPIRRLYV